MRGLAIVATGILLTAGAVWGQQAGTTGPVVATPPTAAKAPVLPDSLKVDMLQAQKAVLQINVDMAQLKDQYQQLNTQGLQEQTKLAELVKKGTAVCGKGFIINTQTLLCDPTPPAPMPSSMEKK